jgi:hypothetical protein
MRLVSSPAPVASVRTRSRPEGASSGSAIASLCRRNDLSLGVRNGARGAVVKLGRSALTLRPDLGPLRSLPLSYAAEHLDHAYALTGHAAQSATVERCVRPPPRPRSAPRLGPRRLLAAPGTRCTCASPSATLSSARRRSAIRTRRLRRERAARALERSSSEPFELEVAIARHRAVLERSGVWAQAAAAPIRRATIPVSRAHS